MVTSNAPTGRNAMALFESVYNKAQLTEEQARRLNENEYNEFSAELLQLIQKHSTTNKYVDEVVLSNYTYPKKYKGPKPIVEQIGIIASMFGLDPTHALEFTNDLPKLPEGAEGWFAVPSLPVVIQLKYFSEEVSYDSAYCRSVHLLFEKIAQKFCFSNYHASDIVPKSLRQRTHTVDFMNEIDIQQMGGILIIPAQLGMRYRGKSVRRARETFANNEFGLDTFTVGCIILSHPKRFTESIDLDINCAGDEFALNTKGVFSETPFYSFDGGRLNFDIDSMSKVCDFSGSASGFIPS